MWSVDKGRSCSKHIVHFEKTETTGSESPQGQIRTNSQAICLEYNSNRYSQTHCFSYSEMSRGVVDTFWTISKTAATTGLEIASEAGNSVVNLRVRAGSTREEAYIKPHHQLKEEWLDSRSRYQNILLSTNCRISLLWWSDYRITDRSIPREINARITSCTQMHHTKYEASLSNTYKTQVYGWTTHIKNLELEMLCKEFSKLSERSNCLSNVRQYNVNIISEHAEQQGTTKVETLWQAKVKLLDWAEIKIVWAFIPRKLKMFLSKPGPSGTHRWTPSIKVGHNLQTCVSHQWFCMFWQVTFWTKSSKTEQASFW